MEDILTRIVAQKKVEVERQKGALPLADLARQLQEQGKQPLRSMSMALSQSASGIIAEFKRKSPSKGWIHQDADPAVVIPSYQANGASALSILTDEPFFGGCLQFIERVRPVINIPILRKEFIIDGYQLYQAKAAGADAVLLIAACLERAQCAELIAQAHSLGLEVLLEVHQEDELAYVIPGVDMVGVNNRNLGTFVTDVNNSFKLSQALKQATATFAQQPVLVSESGLSGAQTILSLREAGYRGFLMGESFMKTSTPGEALHQLISQL